MQSKTHPTTLSLGARISLTNLAFISLVLTGFIVAIVQSMSGLVERKAIDDVTDRTQLVGALLEASDRDLRTRTTVLAKISDPTCWGNSNSIPRRSIWPAPRRRASSWMADS